MASRSCPAGVRDWTLWDVGSRSDEFDRWLVEGVGDDGLERACAALSREFAMERAEVERCARRRFRPTSRAFAVRNPEECIWVCARCDDCKGTRELVFWWGRDDPERCEECGRAPEPLREVAGADGEAR